MKRRINLPPEPADPSGEDFKAATLQAKMAKIKDTNTFKELGEICEKSGEWVRVRLVAQPQRLFKIGKRYQAPRGVAEEFVRSIYR